MDLDVDAYDRLGELAGLVQGGVIGEGEARARVRRDPGFLAGTDLASLSTVTWGLARTERGFGVPLTMLAHEWALAHAPRDTVITGTMFIRAATEVLTAVDDVRLYRHAARAANDLSAHGTVHIHYWTAMMYSAPYALDPANIEYNVNRLRRMSNLWLSHVPVTDEPTLPQPEFGLARAAHHLDQALQMASGEARGQLLTQRAFIEYSRSMAGLPADLSAVDGWCAEAARLLPLDSDPLACNRLVWLTVLRETFDGTRPVWLPQVETMPDGLVNTVLVGTTAARVLGETARPDELRQVIDMVLALVETDPQLETQRQFLELWSVHCQPDDPTTCLDLQRGRVPEHPAVATLVHCLLHDFDQDDELVGEAVESDAPHLSLAFNLAWVHRTSIEARIAAGHGPAEALPALARSVNALAFIGYPQAASCMLGVLTTMFTELPAAELADLDRSFVDELLRIVDVTYGAVDERAWRFATRALSTALNVWVGDRSLSADQVFDLAVYRKGRGLAGTIAVAGPAEPRPKQVECLQWLDEQIEPDEETADAERALSLLADEEALLGAFLQPAEREPGETEVERRANLRRGVQGGDIERMRGAVLAAPHRSLQDVQAALPADALLLTIVLGETDVTAAKEFHAVLVTQDEIAVLDIGDSTKPVSERSVWARKGVHEGAGWVEFSRLGPLIASLRRNLVDDPLHRVVTRAGRAALEEAAGFLTVELLMMLDKFAGTRTRLLLWPHESLYFLPPHLLPFEEGLLADRFDITTVPCLEPLFREPQPAPLGVLAVGCATGGVHVGLHEESLLHTQASRIADLFGTAALIGDQATPAAVFERAANYRFLHIAAHGGQDVDAPVFARLRLAGEPLYAYQVLELDLRGVELVTLCACESALLRYDVLDNLHGLTPAFLRAGAGAVVGALWPVEAEVADTFFIDLYSRLSAGTQPADAFHAARAATREHHPAYRDWGAFSYLGA